MPEYIIDLENQDLWGLAALSNAMNKPVEGQAQSLALDALFFAEGIATRTVYLSMEGNELSMVPARAFGGVGDVTSLDRPEGEPFKLIYLPTDVPIFAHELQGRRQPGSMALETLEYRRDKKLAKARQRLEGTVRYHKSKGLYALKVYDADGSTILLDIAARFGVTRVTGSIALGTATTKVKTKIEEFKDQCADKVGGGATITGWRLDCGRNWFNAFVDHDIVREGYDRVTNGAFLNESQANRPFIFADVEVRKVYGQMKGSDGAAKAWIDPDKAYLYPLFMEPDAYKQWNGPAPVFDQIDPASEIPEEGLPFYAWVKSQDPEGLLIRACAHTLSLPQYPAAVAEISKS